MSQEDTARRAHKETMPQWPRDTLTLSALSVNSSSISSIRGYLIQRHPRRGFTETAAPTIGPIAGPPVIHKVTNDIALPRDAGVKISPSAAGTLLMGADANMPPKNLVRKIAAAFSLLAVPMLKTPRANSAGSILIRRPQTSLIPDHIIGPKAHPKSCQLGIEDDGKNQTAKSNQV